MPDGRQPHRARIAKKEANRPPPGSIADLQAVLWQAIEALERCLADAEGKPDDLRRLTHALAQAAGPYLKATEVGELEARLAALEAHAEALP